MATLIQSYEQQYSVLTADITAKIGRLKLGIEENRDQLIRDIQSNFEEANDLLEQLELECLGAGAGSRVPAAAYRAELTRVRGELRSAIANSNGSQYNIEDDQIDEWGADEQRQKLLDNSERLERIGNTLNDGRRILTETEMTAASVLRDLHHQREVTQRSRDRLRETDEQLNRSSRLMNSMIVRALQDRFILVIVFLVLGVTICFALYFHFT